MAAGVAADAQWDESAPQQAAPPSGADWQAAPTPAQGGAEWETPAAAAASPAPAPAAPAVQYADPQNFAAGY